MKYDVYGLYVGVFELEFEESVHLHGPSVGGSRNVKNKTRTCFSSDSMMASFCLIWARRYSRLLRQEHRKFVESEEPPRDEREVERDNDGGREGVSWGDDERE